MDVDQIKLVKRIALAATFWVGCLVLVVGLVHAIAQVVMIMTMNAPPLRSEWIRWLIGIGWLPAAGYALMRLAGPIAQSVAGKFSS